MLTAVLILMLGGGSVLILSALESNPDGSDVSVIQTVKDVWNDNLNFQQGNTPAPSSTTNNLSLLANQVNFANANATATSQIQASAL